MGRKKEGRELSDAVLVLSHVRRGLHGHMPTPNSQPHMVFFLGPRGPTTSYHLPLPAPPWAPSLQIRILLSSFPVRRPGISVPFSLALSPYRSLRKKGAADSAAGLPPWTISTAAPALPALLFLPALQGQPLALPSVSPLRPSIHPCAPCLLPVPLVVCLQMGREALKDLCRNPGQKKINAICNKSRSKVVT